MSMKRKPPTGNVRRAISLGNNFRGVTTNKQGHLVQFESEQERKLILLLERDPLVVDYVSQRNRLKELRLKNQTKQIDDAANRLVEKGFRLTYQAILREAELSRYACHSTPIRDALARWISNLAPRD